MPGKFNLTIGLMATAAVIAFGVGDAVAQTADMTPALKKLAAAADKEGVILVKYSGGTFGGSRGAKIIERHINEAYGTKIKIRWTPGGSMPSIGNEIAILIRHSPRAGGRSIQRYGFAFPKSIFLFSRLP